MAWAPWLVMATLWTQASLAQTVSQAATTSLVQPIVQPMSQPVLDGARADIHSAFEVDRRACDAREGNNRRLCLKQAQWREQVSLARLEYLHRRDAESRQRLLQLRYEMRDEVSQQRCAPLSPQPRRHCLQRADLEREQAREALASNGPLPDLMDEQQTARRHADHALAMSRCQQLQELAREICIASAEARYGEP